MHEMGIAIQIVNIVNQSLPPGEPLRVKTIQLKLGRLTAIVPQSLSFCMEVATKDTPLEGVELVFKEVPIRVECAACGEETEIQEPPFVCGACGKDQVRIVSGREMIVEAIEVEERGEEGVDSSK